MRLFPARLMLTCISQTVTKKLTRITKMLRDCGKWDIFNLFHVVYLKFYNSFEYLGIDEVSVPFKVMVAFKQYIPKKHKHFVNKIYKLCGTTGYTYDVNNNPWARQPLGVLAYRAAATGRRS
jgi:hypothetical protein